MSPLDATDASPTALPAKMSRAGFPLIFTDVQQESVSPNHLLADIGNGLEALSIGMVGCGARFVSVPDSLEEDVVR